MRPALLVWQVRYEQKQHWRKPQSALFTVALPLVVLVIFSTLNDAKRIHSLSNISYNQYYIPSIIALAIMIACYSDLAITLAVRRETGVLKRLHATPLRPSYLLGGLLGNALVVGLLSAGLTLVLGITVYDVDLPYQALPVLLGIPVGIVTFCALGVAVTRLIPNAESASAITNLPFFALVFISGTFFTVPPGSRIDELAGFFPLRHFTAIIFAGFDPREVGTGLHGGDFAVLGAWAVGAAVLAARSFRWEPRS